ncbi:hypothetical protein SDJN03_05102, partial [Cucurbita argyrosperma subsp. sororia]
MFMREGYMEKQQSPRHKGFHSIVVANWDIAFGIFLWSRAFHPITAIETRDGELDENGRRSGDQSAAASHSGKFLNPRRMQGTGVHP